MHFITLLLFCNTVLPEIKDTSKPLFNVYTISSESKIKANYYSINTGFFCKSERAIEKQIKMPLKLRLGSVEQTQKMEGYNLSSRVP